MKAKLGIRAGGPSKMADSVDRAADSSQGPSAERIHAALLPASFTQQGALGNVT